MQRLPIEPSLGNYRFGTTLDGTDYVIDVRWNGRDAAWYLDIMDSQGTMIRAGIKAVLGAPLGRRCMSEDFPPGILIASDQTQEGLDAEFNDFGTRVVIDFIVWSELSELASE